MSCIFCKQGNEHVLYNCDLYRIIVVEDKYYPGYMQIVANKHIKELSDLGRFEAVDIFRAIWQLETRMRDIFKPDKVNIASFGNMVPHLHWHIIPRFEVDRHYPNSIWGEVTHPEYLPSAKLYDLHNHFSSVMAKL